MRLLCASRCGINSVDYFGMLFLIKTGILVLLITSVIGRSLLSQEFEESNVTNVSSYEEPLENNCNCEWRYYKHYEAKGCEVVQVDSCGCPKKYSCPLSSDTEEEQKVCIYQNQEYKIGSRINVTDKCQSCRCLGGDQPQITCRLKECPQLEHIEDRNCHLVYEKDHCCPSKYECVLNAMENEAIDGDSFCVYDGISYPLGAKIYPSDDPCLICDCTENWNGVSNSSCHQQNCIFEKNKLLLLKGCVPIYHENKCCPIEFYCPQDQNLSADFSMENNITAEHADENGYCTFGEVSYTIGHELSMKNPCIKCNCLVPPDFTCVHQSCTPPPTTRDCQVFHSSNHCCPVYDCLQNDDAAIHSNNSLGNDCPTPQCADATCIIKIPDGHVCPTCVCDDDCPTPQCADATCIIKVLDGHVCPTCVCNESISHEKNLFEPEDDKLMEGSLKNNSSNNEDLEHESENFESEVLIPIESNPNTNASEKFVEFPPNTDNLEYEEVEHAEHEKIDIFEKESGTFHDNEDREEYIESDKIFVSNASSISETEELIEIRKKRSIINQEINYQQQNLQIVQNQQQFFEEEDTESEREVLEGSDDGFDELKLSNLGRSNRNNDDGNSEEDLIGSESVIVPPGCPTPLCANASCKIEIPEGHHCPSCICKSRENWQP